MIKSYLFSNLINKITQITYRFNFKDSDFFLRNFASFTFMVATSKNKQILFLRFCNILRDPLISVGMLWKMEKFDFPLSFNF